ncbi:MAG: glycosyltransferase family 2 protein [Bacteroidales bacterium]
MNFAHTYFSRFHTFGQYISTPPSPDAHIIVVIPCFSEPDIIDTLTSLQSCNKPDCDVEILVVVNFSETAPEADKQYNADTYKCIQTYSTKHSTKKHTIHPIYAPNAPKKHAGVGWARKVGMDEAVRRFDTLNNAQGIIVACDADTGVAPNYFTEIERFYATHPAHNVAHIYFEHPLSGELDDTTYTAIAQYELHLRLYVEALHYIKFPYPYHTVGSCMTVRALSYCKHGGMNKRQAGEDFYFLQKLYQAEHVGEITGTTVFPSARISHRVPFGTGHAMTQMISSSHPVYYSYHPKSYTVLHSFFSVIPTLHSAETEEIKHIFSNLHPSVQTYIGEQQFITKTQEIQSHSSSQHAFIQRFFQWTNAFFIFRFLNESHKTYFTKIPIHTAATLFLHTPENYSIIELLTLLRRKQQSNHRSSLS